MRPVFAIASIGMKIAQELKANAAAKSEAAYAQAQGSPVDVAAKIAERAQRDHLTTLYGGAGRAQLPRRIDRARINSRGCHGGRSVEAAAGALRSV